MENKEVKKGVFSFKQFCIHHDRCAMKVGTDSVLLGAWGCVGGKRILDIGTGSGIIALMAAQRNLEAMVLGIDIDEQAVLQAQENVAESIYSKRIRCFSQNVMTFCQEEPFDAILCNPPFFTEDTLPDNTSRALARNSKSLPFPQLINKAALLLNDNGRFSVIIPSSHMQDFVGLCLIEKLNLERRCIVRTKTNKPPRRVLLTFIKGQSERCIEQDLCLTNPDGSRTQEYIELTKVFYL